MLSVKTINNQNAITNAVLGLDGNSSTIVNGNLIVQDANNSFTITPTGALPTTNTTFNNITVNGTSNFNSSTFFYFGGRVYSNSFILFNTDFRVMDATGTLGFQIYNSNDGNNFTTIQGIGANSKFSINTRDATTQRNNIQIQNGNQVTIQGTAGQGINFLNDQITHLGQTNFKNNVNLSLYNFDITNTAGTQGMRIFNNGGAGLTEFHGIGNSTRFNFYSTDGLGVQTINLWISNGNSVVLQGQTGQGISIVNDQTTLSGLTPIITNGPVLGDNSNKIATTSFVQSSTTQFLRGYKFMTNPSLPFTTTPIGNLNINFTNGSSLKINDSITIRFSIRYDYNDTSSTAQSTYYNSYYGNLIIFPNRVITNTSSVPVYLSGSLNGQTSYTYNNATFAPSGRYIWTENYSNTQAIDSLNNNPNPVIITTVLQSQLTLQFNMPFNTTSVPNSNCSLSVYLELINNNFSTLTTITTTGSSFFDSVQKTF